jgi:hypothetical protein
LRNTPFLATNILPSVFMVKWTPSGYSGITYKDTLIWFGNLFGRKCFTQTSHPQILRMKNWVSTQSITHMVSFQQI